MPTPYPLVRAVAGDSDGSDSDGVTAVSGLPATPLPRVLPPLVVDVVRGDVKAPRPVACPASREVTTVGGDGLDDDARGAEADDAVDDDDGGRGTAAPLDSGAWGEGEREYGCG